MSADGASARDRRRPTHTLIAADEPVAWQVIATLFFARAVFTVERDGDGVTMIGVTRDGVRIVRDVVEVGE